MGVGFHPQKSSGAPTRRCRKNNNIQRAGARTLINQCFLKVIPSSEVFVPHQRDRNGNNSYLTIWKTLIKAVGKIVR